MTGVCQSCLYQIGLLLFLLHLRWGKKPPKPFLNWTFSTAVNTSGIEMCINMFRWLLVYLILFSVVLFVADDRKQACYLMCFVCFWFSCACHFSDYEWEMLTSGICFFPRATLHCSINGQIRCYSFHDCGAERTKMRSRCSQLHRLSLQFVCVTTVML